MITPGSILYRFRNGPGTVWYRDVIRPRILKTRPLTGLNDERCEIHVLTSKHDWLNAIWTLKTFFYFSNRKYKLCFHDDGTLGPIECGALKHHFPDARLVLEEEALQKADEQLQDFPRCLEFRRTNHLSPKILDFFLFLASPKMLIIDSDVLFFCEPTALIASVEETEPGLAAMNRDIESVYTINAEAAREMLAVTLDERINSGLGVVPKDYFNPQLLEKSLSIDGIVGHFWRIEQTLLAILCSAGGHVHLPGEYDVYIAKRPLGKRPARHYVGAVRHLMYREGIRRLCHSGFLRKASTI
jgi:hypothetical protein